MSLGAGRGGGEGVRIRDHLANVRTLLAWHRAGIVLLGMGYVIARFETIEQRPQRLIGVAVSITGWLVVAVAGWRYLVRRRSIEQSSFVPAVAADVALIGLAALAGIVVLVYLWRS